MDVGKFELLKPNTSLESRFLSEYMRINFLSKVNNTFNTVINKILLFFFLKYDLYRRAAACRIVRAWLYEITLYFIQSIRLDITVLLVT